MSLRLFQFLQNESQHLLWLSQVRSSQTHNPSPSGQDSRNLTWKPYTWAATWSWMIRAEVYISSSLILDSSVDLLHTIHLVQPTWAIQKINDLASWRVLSLLVSSHETRARVLHVSFSGLCQGKHFVHHGVHQPDMSWNRCPEFGSCDLKYAQPWTVYRKNLQMNLCCLVRETIKHLLFPLCSPPPRHDHRERLLANPKPL